MRVPFSVDRRVRIRQRVLPDVEWVGYPMRRRRDAASALEFIQQNVLRTVRISAEPKERCPRHVHNLNIDR